MRQVFSPTRHPALAAGFALMLTLAWAGQAHADQVVVFAAASLKTGLDQVARDFEATSGHRVSISYAASNQLAQQIIQGAPADIFISASEPWMDEVEAAAALVPGSRLDLLGNALAMVGALDAAPLTLSADLDLAGRLGEQRLAMAMVDAVPAGQYGKAALLHLGLWDQVAPRLVQTENVRAALALVSRGEAPMGVVYATDASADPGVQVLATFPAESHAPILYPAALLQGASDAGDRAFFAHLCGAQARATFAAQGFTQPPEQGCPAP